MRSFVLVGHSHAKVLASAARAMARPHRLVDLHEFNSPISAASGRMQLADELLRTIQIAAAGFAEPQLVSCVGGNVHNVMSLLKSVRPFDFVLSEQPTLALDATTQIVPEGAMHDTIRSKAERQLSVLRCLASDLNARLTHVESPPPNGDDSYCLEKIDTVFRATVASRGIAPRLLRYKMWRLHSRIFREACAEAGIRFLPAPRESMDDSGFLARSYYGNATHANGRYGQLVIRQLEAL